MSNFETPPQTFAQEAPETPIEDRFEDAESFQNDAAFQAEVARRARAFNEEQAFSDTILPQEGDQIDDSRAPAHARDSSVPTGVKIVAGVTAGLAAVSAGAIAYDQHGPQTVIAQETTTIQPGEGVAQAVDTGIEYLEQRGVDPADISSAMRQDVISQAVELTQENGVVQPGQNVELVATESPLGTLNVEAVAPQEQPVSQAGNESQELTAPDTH